MAEVTRIAWCDHTFNGWIGCSRISPGCANCYAANDTYVRVARSRGLELWGESAGRHLTSEANWRKPLAWNLAAREAGERRRVFASSLCDVFEDRPDLDQSRARLFGLICATKSLDWLVLTKRPEVAAAYFHRRGTMWAAAEAYRDLVYGKDSDVGLGDGLADWPPRNVWLGTTVENRRHGLPRIDVLRTIPATVRFLSVEPQIEDLGSIDLTGIHWVIQGGESGPNARPFRLEWARSLREQCRKAGVAYFLKQLGRVPRVNYYDEELRQYHDENGWDWPDPDDWSIEHDGQPYLNATVTLRTRDRAGADPDEWPPDLVVREFPEGR